MTEGVNKEQVKGAESPAENKIETKSATKGVAWYDIAVILLFFMLFGHQKRLATRCKPCKQAILLIK